MTVDFKASLQLASLSSGCTANPSVAEMSDADDDGLLSVRGIIAFEVDN
jgi:hypothetical protein